MSTPSDSVPQWFPPDERTATPSPRSAWVAVAWSVVFVLVVVGVALLFLGGAL